MTPTAKVRSRTLRFGTRLEVEIDDVPCELVFEAAPPSPWYGAPNGPTAYLSADADVAEILDALDPFDRRE